MTTTGTRQTFRSTAARDVPDEHINHQVKEEQDECISEMHQVFSEFAINQHEIRARQARKQELMAKMSESMASAQ